MYFGMIKALLHWAAINKGQNKKVNFRRAISVNLMVTKFFYEPGKWVRGKGVTRSVWITI